MKFLPFTSVTRWLLVVIGCVVLATAQPMSAADENTTGSAVSTTTPAASNSATPPPAASTAPAATTNLSAPNPSGGTVTVALPPVSPASPSSSNATATPASVAKSDTIIYPKASGTNSDQTLNGKAAETSHSYFLVVALLLAAAGAWVLIQKQRGVSVVSRGPKKLNVEETRPLGNRQYLVVASYENKKFLLGVTAGQIQMLSRLDAGDAEASGRGEGKS